MTRDSSTTMYQWLVEPLSPEVTDSVSRLMDADDVQRLAIMPDVHLSKDVCVGVVMATQELVYPSAVGSDIGCGMAAVRLNCTADTLSSERVAAEILAGLYQFVPAMRHSRETMPSALPNDLLETPLSHPKLERLKSRDGRIQLGTLGRGNHFLEFQTDAEGQLWLMVHSGSRGIGQAISTHHQSIAQSTSLRRGLAAFRCDSPEGVAFLADALWAERYAECNRLAIIGAVAQMCEKLLGARLDEPSLIHSNHNHVRRELHQGRPLWIHRKGALPAHIDEIGVIPGSMGTPSFHVAGRGCAKSLCSSSHGAGRTMRRGEAMKCISEKQLLREMDHVWFDRRKLQRLRDEAPSAYKDIRKVMRAQRDLTRIVRELRPVLNYKGC